MGLKVYSYTQYQLTSSQYRTLTMVALAKYQEEYDARRELYIESLMKLTESKINFFTRKIATTHLYPTRECAEKYISDYEDHLEHWDGYYEFAKSELKRAKSFFNHAQTGVQKIFISKDDFDFLTSVVDAQDLKPIFAKSMLDRDG